MNTISNHILNGYVNSIIDTGVPLSLFSDYVTSYSSYISIIKLGFGTALLYSDIQLKHKIQKAKEHGILICPGGTLFEVMYHSNKVETYIDWVCNCGFNAIEFSTGVYDISDKIIQNLIARSLDNQLKVLVEIGKKSPSEDEKITPEERVFKINNLANLGCYKIIIEARESGTLGIYDENGDVKATLLNYIVQHTNHENILFESPNKAQQAYLINVLGSKVGLANLAFTDVLSVMALRYGLRADTIKS